MSREDFLTIVVPAYNVGSYIGECLNSLVSQSSQSFQVIVIDDGSTDGETARIGKKYAEQYPERIKYFRQENKGLGAARNAGLKRVTTPYVGFLDSDDWLMPNYVERVIEDLQEYAAEQIDIAFTVPVIFNSITKCYEKWYDADAIHAIFFTENRVIYPAEEKRLYYLEPNACRRVYRTAFLRDLNFRFPVGVKWEDIPPHFYLLYHARTCIGIEDVGFYYRINTANQITACSDKGRLDIVKVFAKTLAMLKLESWDEAVMHAVIKMMNRYSKWCIEVSAPEIRTELTERLHRLYCSVPPNYFKSYFCHRRHHKKERILVMTLRSHSLYKLHNDYLPTELAMAVFRKIRRMLCFH